MLVAIPTHVPIPPISPMFTLLFETGFLAPNTVTNPISVPVPYMANSTSGR
jgi:hypothetical protein